MVKDTEQVKNLHRQRDDLFNEIGKVIIGQKKIIKQLLIAQLCRGHCLLIGVPGLAKTMMISSLAEMMDLKFSRIQFTPDLMPS
ncbi:MAG: AAA family ATPase, partial [Candidatus Marinimicrobia bacterium]|nr:AAA family ATPase [Candidatus Neomarinimicrobiota bacterium]